MVALQPNLTDQVDWALAYDLYFLAMSQHQLGESTRARQFYDLAVRWSGAHPGPDNLSVGEMTAIQAEAADLLGVKDKSKASRNPLCKLIRVAEPLPVVDVSEPRE
jgi:hypothetical protein